MTRKQKIHDLPDAEKICACCQVRVEQVGEETSEQIEFIPASLFVLKHGRLKCACRKCEEQIIRAPKPPQPIEKGLPGSGLLAHVITGKYAEHVPL